MNKTVTRARPEGRLLLSVVVPMHNEADGLGTLFERLEPILADVTSPTGQDYEIICVDDGSTDGTDIGLQLHHARNPRIKVLCLSRNFGKDIALTAGLDHASGQAVVPMDADLQDPPELIPELVARWREGNDVVYASRISRQGDTVAKRLTAGWYYRAYNTLADVDIPHNTGDFRLMDRRVVAALRRMPERNRFMKGLFAWVGFRQTRVDYVREARSHGSTKWSPWRLWNFGLDGITSASTAPLRIWSYVGAIVFVASLVYAAFLVADTLINGVDVPGYASLMVVVLFLGGMNLLTLGIIGEYLGRVYTEVKARPLYLVRDAYGFAPAQSQGTEWNDRSTSESTPSRTAIGGS